MKYTILGESGVVNIAGGKGVLYLSRDFSKISILSYKQSGSALSVLLYFRLMDVLTKTFL